MKIVFAGGGTAGHINPALAIARHIKSVEPNTEILFVGTKRGLEAQLVPKAGFNIKFIDIAGFQRKFDWEFIVHNTKSVLKIFGAFAKCKRILKDFKPDVVVGTGGYVSGPLLYTATKLKIPTVIHEQNVFPGMTSKILSKKVGAVAISFEESRNIFVNAKKIIHTGNPLRDEIFSVEYSMARAKLKLDDKPFILAFGGSLGAEKMNSELIDFIAETKDDGNYNLLFATGNAHYDDVLKTFKDKNIDLNRYKNIKVVNYIDNIPDALNAADLVIARAGAITVSEITALGKPSILIPSPNVTNNHQEYNARALEKVDAAVVLTENQLTKGVLTAEILRLIENKKVLKKMSENAYKIGIKDGTEKLCNLIWSEASGKNN